MEEKMLLSVGDASLILRVGERQVRRYCNEEKLVCRKDGKAFEIEYDSVLEFLRNNTSLELDEDIASDEEEPDADTDAGVRSEEADVRKAEERASEKASAPPKREKPAQDDSDTLSDISVLSERLQESIQAVRTSQEALCKFANLLYQRLVSEQKRNQEIQSSLASICRDLQIANPKSKKKRLWAFLSFLPMLMFVVWFFWL